MAWTTWSCSTPTATGNDIARKRGQKPTASRERRWRRLEPDALQGACPVLRGGGVGDTPPTILQTAPLGAVNKRVGWHLVDHAHFFLVDFDALDQRPEDLPPCLPRRLRQPLPHAPGECFDLADRSAHLFGRRSLPLSCHQLPLDALHLFLQPPHALLELRPLHQPRLIGIQ